MSDLIPEMTNMIAAAPGTYANDDQRRRRLVVGWWRHDGEDQWQKRTSEAKPVFAPYGTRSTSFLPAAPGFIQLRLYKSRSGGGWGQIECYQSHEPYYVARVPIIGWWIEEGIDEDRHVRPVTTEEENSICLGYGVLYPDGKVGNPGTGGTCVWISESAWFDDHVELAIAMEEAGVC